MTKSDKGSEYVSAHIVATVLSKNSPDFVWVAFSDGRIWYINWTSGSGVDTPFTVAAKKVLDMTVESVELGDSVEDVLLVLQKKSKSSGHIVAYDHAALLTSTGKVLHTYDESPQLLRSAAGGRVIVAAAKETLHIGLFKAKRKAVSVDDLEYFFHSFGVPDIVTCVDIRPIVQMSKKGGVELRTIDLVVGCARGTIYLYDDLLSKLPSGPSSSKATPFNPRKYHWHRRAVHSVKWSEDGKHTTKGEFPRSNADNSQVTT